MVVEIPIEVESYSGYRTHESPRAIHWRGERLEVEDIIDRWYEGGVDPTASISDYFRVQTSDGQQHLVKRDRGEDRWYILRPA